MDDYLPHQRDKLSTNKWEEEYQGGYDTPKFDYIDGIHEYVNDESYNGYIGAEFQITDVSGNPRLGKVLILGRVSMEKA